VTLQSYSSVGLERFSISSTREAAVLIGWRITLSQGLPRTVWTGNPSVRRGKILRFLHSFRNGMSPYINFVLNTEFSLQNSGRRNLNIYWIPQNGTIKFWLRNFCITLILGTLSYIGSICGSNNQICNSTVLVWL
jgi:hypothetical protein